MADLTPYKRNKMVSPFGIFDDFWNGNWASFPSMSNHFRVDVQEEKDRYLVEAELPGIDKENISVELNSGYLLIKTEQKNETNEDSSKYVHRERHCETMQRSIYLGDVKPEGITARLENGLLKISVQKEDSQSKRNRIEIE